MEMKTKNLKKALTYTINHQGLHFTRYDENQELCIANLEDYFIFLREKKSLG